MATQVFTVLLSSIGLLGVAFSISILENIGSLLSGAFTVTAYRQLWNNEEDLADVFE